MKTPTYEIVQLILRRGNGPGLITEWFAGMRAWADANTGQDADALRLWLDLVGTRPFYTAEELSRLWPALQLTLGLQKKMVPVPAANRLANELAFYRLPILKNADGKDFFFKGGTASREKFFIVEHCHAYRDVAMPQEEFDRIYFEARGMS